LGANRFGGARFFFYRIAGAWLISTTDDTTAVVGAEVDTRAGRLS